ncbi:hypothetical protein Tco_1521034, partial [Tanacetum coccineum]
GKKSISFLLKKIFVCSSGFPTIPSLRDPLPESRMEKILRAMLKNKINPQHSQASSGRKKGLMNFLIRKVDHILDPITLANPFILAIEDRVKFYETNLPSLDEQAWRLTKPHVLAAMTKPLRV